MSSVKLFKNFWIMLIREPQLIIRTHKMIRCLIYQTRSITVVVNLVGPPPESDRCPIFWTNPDKYTGKIFHLSKKSDFQTQGEGTTKLTTTVNLIFFICHDKFNTLLGDKSILQDLNFPYFVQQFLYCIPVLFSSPFYP